MKIRQAALIAVLTLVTCASAVAAEIYSSRGIDFNPHVSNYKPLRFVPFPNINHELGIGFGAPKLGGSKIGMIFQIGDGGPFALGGVGGVLFGDHDVFYRYDPSRTYGFTVLPYASLRWTPRFSSLTVVREIRAAR